MTLKHSLPIIASILFTFAVIAQPNSALAQYAFGFSTYDGNETLTLKSNGANITIPTNGFQGWVGTLSDNLSAGPNGNTNYYAPQPFDDSRTFDYFVFDISGLKPNITSATLTISPFLITNKYDYSLHDATSFVADLFDVASPNPTLVDQMAAGTTYGAYSVNPSQSYGPLLTFALNAQAVNDINGYIAAGDTQFALSGTVTVPEPATWVMLLLGVAIMGGGLRMAHRKDAVAPVVA